jgi:PTH1 family peptidyl-tRNA hydrolase
VKLLVGLGNPGKRYAGTPHNAGFAVIDLLARGWDCTPRRSLRFRAKLGRAVLGEENLLLLKPQTYMNNSGMAVSAVMRYRKLSLRDLLVILDDADLAVGSVRIRKRGSSGGHKGLDSIIRLVGGSDFTRVRIGVGRDTDRDLVDHVLTPFSGPDQRRFEDALDRAAEAVTCVLRDGVEAAMNRFNGLPPAGATGNATRETVDS